MSNRQIIVKPSNVIKVDRPNVNLMTSKSHCARALNNANKHYEGWSNSATWAFSVYFLQERENYETLCEIIRRWHRPGKPLTEFAYGMAKNAMEIAYWRERMEPFDGDEEGSVNVREIVDTLAEEIFPATDQPANTNKA